MPRELRITLDTFFHPPPFFVVGNIPGLKILNRDRVDPRGLKYCSDSHPHVQDKHLTRDHQINNVPRSSLNSVEPTNKILISRHVNI
jgi:hypothetical protein